MEYVWSIYLGREGNGVEYAFNICLRRKVGI